MSSPRVGLLSIAHQILIVTAVTLEEMDIFVLTNLPRGVTG